jgi:acyl-lipid omega-6 desaturase (Delta-12 desaturase)
MRHPPSNSGSLRSLLPDVPASPATRLGGTAALLLLLGLWLSIGWLALQTRPGPAQAALGLLLGTLAALLVVVGHDAEHGSLSPWPRWNALASRLAFVPAWQPASGWTHEHRLHHAWTNLKQRDQGYPPPSPADWLRLARRQRLWWRCALTVPGVGLLYLDVWWRCVIWVRQPPEGRRLMLRADSLLVLAFAAAQVAMAWRFAGGGWAVLWLVALPFAVMNTWVSAITLMHHRHPRVRWFDDESAWTRLHGQVAGTVHLVLPPAWQWALLNIFEHGAHHVDLRRPFVALPAAQQALEQRCGMEVVVQHEPAPWRLRHLRRVMRECQLYDYRRHRWLRFDAAAADA